MRFEFKFFGILFIILADVLWFMLSRDLRLVLSIMFWLMILILAIQREHYNEFGFNDRTYSIIILFLLVLIVYLSIWMYITGLGDGYALFYVAFAFVGTDVVYNERLPRSVE